MSNRKAHFGTKISSVEEKRREEGTSLDLIETMKSLKEYTWNCKEDIERVITKQKYQTNLKMILLQNMSYMQGLLQPKQLVKIEMCIIMTISGNYMQYELDNSP